MLAGTLNVIVKVVPAVTKEAQYPKPCVEICEKSYVAPPSIVRLLLA